MQLLHRDQQGAPLGLIKVHPVLRRFVAFSATVDDAVLWGWDYERVERVARLGARRERRSIRELRIFGSGLEVRREFFDRDVAFHPDAAHMAVAGEGRPIEIYRVLDGGLTRTMGDSAGRLHMSERLRLNKTASEYSAECQGFDRITFSDFGRLLVAQPIAEMNAHVLEFGSAVVIATLWEGFAPFAIHRPDELIAMVRNDQSGTEIRWARARRHSQNPKDNIGWAPQRVKVSQEEDDWGWSVPTMINVSGMVFSPDGDAFALSGEGFGIDSRTIAVSVHEFPSLRTRFVRTIEFDDKPIVDPFPIPWPIATHPVAFGPGGRRLYVPEGVGLITVLDANTGEEIDFWDAHADQVCTIDVQHETGILISGDLEGEVKVWSLSDS